MIKSFVTTADQTGERVDRVVASVLPDISRTLIQKLILEGHVLRNGKPTRPSERLQSRDEVEIRVSLPPSLSAKPESVELDVVYEDGALAVINKPAGLVVHPSAGHGSGTLVNGLVQRYPILGRETGLRPGIVHRLDKGTSGLMVVALTPEAQLHLSRQLRARTIKRGYHALVSGKLHPDRAVIDVPVGRDPVSRKRMGAGLDTIRSREARTRYTVVERLHDFTLLDITLETGRTHQIRVHMAYIGHPVAGDPMYGRDTVVGLQRQFLHAQTLSFKSLSGEDLSFYADLPPDLAGPLESLRADSRNSDV